MVLVGWVSPRWAKKTRDENPQEVGGGGGRDLGPQGSRTADLGKAENRWV